MIVKKNLPRLLMTAAGFDGQVMQQMKSFRLLAQAEHEVDDIGYSGHYCLEFVLE